MDLGISTCGSASGARAPELIALDRANPSDFLPTPWAAHVNRCRDIRAQMERARNAAATAGISSATTDEIVRALQAELDRTNAAFLASPDSPRNLRFHTIALVPRDREGPTAPGGRLGANLPSPVPARLVGDCRGNHMQVGQSFFDDVAPGDTAGLARFREILEETRRSVSTFGAATTAISGLSAFRSAISASAGHAFYCLLGESGRRHHRRYHHSVDYVVWQDLDKDEILTSEGSEVGTASVHTRGGGRVRGEPPAGYVTESCLTDTITREPADADGSTGAAGTVSVIHAGESASDAVNVLVNTLGGAAPSTIERSFESFQRDGMEPITQAYEDFRHLSPSDRASVNEGLSSALGSSRRLLSHGDDSSESDPGAPPPPPSADAPKDDGGSGASGDASSSGRRTSDEFRSLLLELAECTASPDTICRCTCEGRMSTAVQRASEVYYPLAVTVGLDIWMQIDAYEHNDTHGRDAFRAACTPPRGTRCTEFAPSSSSGGTGAATTGAGDK